MPARMATGVRLVPMNPGEACGTRKMAARKRHGKASSDRAIMTAATLLSVMDIPSLCEPVNWRRARIGATTRIRATSMLLTARSICGTCSDEIVQNCAPPKRSAGSWDPRERLSEAANRAGSCGAAALKSKREAGDFAKQADAAQAAGDAEF